MVQEAPKKDVFVNKMTLDVLSSLIRVSRQKKKCNPIPLMKQ